MRNILSLCFSLLVISVLAFSGCEAGLGQSDSSEDEMNNKFSFSDMYSKLKTMQEEIDNLKQTNQELQTTVELLTGGSLSSIDTIETRLNDVESTLINLNIGTIETRLSDVESTVTNLNTAFSGVSRDGSTITFSGVNVQIVNGSGSTYGLNGLGNLVVGYNDARYDALPDGFKNTVQTGSHNVVIGGYHNFTSYGGIVAGRCNSITGAGSSVTGGKYNIASGVSSSVVGGLFNTASANYSVLP
ncbi:MAG: hypothetical protein GY754_16715 [bacterium]|nr:hypothetical protein [bacterium]